MFFDELAKYPWRAERFAKAMSLHQTRAEYHTSHLLDNYPWSELGTCTVVNVGGSHGASSVALAKRFPAINCIVQDLPESVASSTVPAELEGRVSFMAHDFFTEQPIKGAEIYFFRWIFHDWSDEYSRRILRCLIPALKPQAKIVIQDSVVPEHGATSMYEERQYRWVFEEIRSSPFHKSLILLFDFRYCRVGLLILQHGVELQTLPCLRYQIRKNDPLRNGKH